MVRQPPNTCIMFFSAARASKILTKSLQEQHMHLLGGAVWAAGKDSLRTEAA
jgi:hypothetical protein